MKILAVDGDDEKVVRERAVEGSATEGDARPLPTMRRVAIQGELGSNSHLAAMTIAPGAAIRSSAQSLLALEACMRGEVDGVVLPIENSLHGSVVDHYDLLLAHPVRMVRELNLRVRHHVIAPPGVTLAEVRRVLSHPVALSQCRHWLAAHGAIDAVSFYDTAGAVKHVLEERHRDAAGIAPRLAAEVYGGTVLAADIEDHAENYTRFHLIVPETAIAGWEQELTSANKMSVAFAVEHRPGTLVAALDRMAKAGADLTKIESRPVPGRPWEYLFYVDLRFEGSSPQADAAKTVLRELEQCCTLVRELGRYRAAVA